MRSKDLCKLLQEVDPEGNAVVRIDNGAIAGLVKNPGFESDVVMFAENDKLVFSGSAEKVDIIPFGIEELAWSYRGNIKDIENKIVFEDLNEQQKKMLNKHILQSAMTAQKRYGDIINNGLSLLYERIIHGYEIVQEKGKIAPGKQWFRKPESKNLATFEDAKRYQDQGEHVILTDAEYIALTETGKFEAIELDGYICWGFKK